MNILSKILVLLLPGHEVSIQVLCGATDLDIEKVRLCVDVLGRMGYPIIEYRYNVFIMYNNRDGFPLILDQQDLDAIEKCGKFLKTQKNKKLFNKLKPLFYKIELFLEYESLVSSIVEEPEEDREINNVFVFHQVEEVHRFKEIVEYAISNDLDMELYYRDNKGNTTTRKIKPVDCFSENKEVYIPAYCHLRRGERLFKSSGIIKYRVIN